MTIIVNPDKDGNINEIFYLYKNVKEGNPDKHYYVMESYKFAESWEGYLYCGEVTGNLSYEVPDELSLEKEALEERLEGLRQEQREFNAEAQATQTVIESRLQVLTQLTFKGD